MIGAVLGSGVKRGWSGLVARGRRSREGETRCKPQMTVQCHNEQEPRQATTEKDEERVESARPPPWVTSIVGLTNS